MRRLLTTLPALLILSACASPPEAGAGAGADAGAEGQTVQVSVTYRERIMLPPGHLLTVRVEDVSLADAPARVMAEAQQALEGRAPPYAVSLTVPGGKIDPRHTYAVRADIRDPSGALRFTTDTRHSVLTQGAPNSAEITLVGVR